MSPSREASRVVVKLLLASVMVASALEPVSTEPRRVANFTTTRDGHDCAGNLPENHPCANIMGLRQSPIVIDPCAAEGTIRRPLKITNLDAVPSRMTVVNTGDRVAGDVFWAPGQAPVISGGNLIGEYTYMLYDLHWGVNPSVATEHKIPGTQYSGELHLGFVNNKYATVEEALTNVDGVVALAIFLDESVVTPGRGITALTPALFQIETALSEAELASPPTTRELLPGNLRSYVRYDGSFTSVPPCSEAAIWIVLLEPIRILDLELDLLMDLRDITGQRLCTSLNRVTQPVSGRRLESTADQVC